MTKDQLADMAEQAARLAKADLVTEMVGEFPELQGLMGGYYARAEGLPDAVADAIRDHYKPVGQGDDVPTAPVTVAVSLADKLDTLRSFFSIEHQPTGSKDPFALRRAVPEERGGKEGEEERGKRALEAVQAHRLTRAGSGGPSFRALPKATSSTSSPTASRSSSARQAFGTT